MKITKELLQDLDTSKLTTREIWNYLQRKVSINTVQRFVRRNQIPVRRQSRAEISQSLVRVSRDELQAILNDLTARGQAQTRANVAKELGVSKQRASYLMLKHGFTRTNGVRL
ncbi:hypothetical protein MAFF241648_21610 [Ralstonia solanacearum]|nr:hypothetical protein MAFF241648_21610 [Ralstonia solanacearum]